MQHGQNEDNVYIADAPAFDGGLAVSVSVAAIKAQVAVLVDTHVQE